MKTSATTFDSLIALYKRSNERVDWKDLVFQTLYKRMDMVKHYLSIHRWNTMLAYYHIDLLNFPEEK